MQRYKKLTLVLAGLYASNPLSANEAIDLDDVEVRAHDNAVGSSDAASEG